MRRVGACLEEVGREAVAERVGIDPLGDAGPPRRPDAACARPPCARSAARRRPLEADTRPWAASLPVVRSAARSRGLNGTTRASPPLPARTWRTHALGVDVAALERAHLADPQAGPVGRHHDRPMLRRAPQPQEPHDLRRAQDLGQPLRHPRPRNPDRHRGAVQRHAGRGTAAPRCTRPGRGGHAPLLDQVREVRPVPRARPTPLASADDRRRSPARSAGTSVACGRSSGAGTGRPASDPEALPWLLSSVPPPVSDAGWRE